jgi:hypothetical protein
VSNPKFVISTLRLISVIRVVLKMKSLAKKDNIPMRRRTTKTMGAVKMRRSKRSRRSRVWKPRKRVN